jgi:hypothetical protein
MRYLLFLSLTLAVCFGFQTYALNAVGGRTTKSESNFFSSIARIQTGVGDNPRIMLLGSSMTGRFPDRSSGFDGVSSLGCDGSSAVDTLRAMDRGELPYAPILVIEGNTFYRAVGSNKSEIAQAIASPWFEIGINTPQLSASARPAAFAYSRLLAAKIGRSEGPDGRLLPVSTKALVCTETQHLAKNEGHLICEMEAIFMRLQNKGVKLMIVILPPGKSKDTPNVRLPAEISRRTKVPLLDLTDSLPKDSVRFTDGVHMDPQSADAALRTILKALGELI